MVLPYLPHQSRLAKLILLPLLFFLEREFFSNSIFQLHEELLFSSPLSLIYIARLEISCRRNSIRIFGMYSLLLKLEFWTIEL